MIELHTLVVIGLAIALIIIWGITSWMRNPSYVRAIKRRLAERNNKRKVN